MSVRHESVDIAPRTSGPSQSHSLEGREVAVEVVAVHDLPGGGCRQVQDAVPHPDAVVLEGQASSVGGGGRYVGGRSKWGGALPEPGCCPHPDAIVLREGREGKSWGGVWRGCLHVLNSAQACQLQNQWPQIPVPPHPPGRLSALSGLRPGRSTPNSPPGECRGDGWTESVCLLK